MGRLGGVEEDVAGSVCLTDPAEAAEFVAKSGCDSLAVAIGTSHGAYKFAGKQGLHFDVLEKLRASLPKDFPMVMHGSSSVPKEWVDRINNAGGKMKSTSGVNEDQYLPAAKLGVCKVNIDTDGRLVWCAIHREAVPRRSGQFRPASAREGLYGRLRRLHRSQEHEARLRRPVGVGPQDAEGLRVCEVADQLPSPAGRGAGGEGRMQCHCWLAQQCSVLLRMGKPAVAPGAKREAILGFGLTPEEWTRV